MSDRETSKNGRKPLVFGLFDPNRLLRYVVAVLVALGVWGANVEIERHKHLVQSDVSTAVAESEKRTLAEIVELKSKLGILQGRVHGNEKIVIRLNVALEGITNRLDKLDDRMRDVQRDLQRQNRRRDK